MEPFGGRGVLGVRIGRSSLKVLIPVGALVNFFSDLFFHIRLTFLLSEYPQ